MPGPDPGDARDKAGDECRVGCLPVPCVLVNWPVAGKGVLRLNGYLAKGLLVLRQILTKHVVQGLGLLRAKKNTLKILYRHSIWRFLTRGAKDETEIPYTDADMHAVGVDFPVRCIFNDIDFRLAVQLGHA